MISWGFCVKPVFHPRSPRVLRYLLFTNLNSNAAYYGWNKRSSCSRCGLFQCFRIFWYCNEKSADAAEQHSDQEHETSPKHNADIFIVSLTTSSVSSSLTRSMRVLLSALMTPLLRVIWAFDSRQRRSKWHAELRIISRCIPRCSLMWVSLRSVLWSQSSQDRLAGIHHNDCTVGAYRSYCGGTE